MDRLVFSSRESLDQSLAERVAQALQSAIAQRGQATLVVSGGSTPMGFFQQLSQQALDWKKVTITLADERWVEADHPDSNAKLLHDQLLINAAADAQFIPLKNGAPTAQDGVAWCEKGLSDMAPFDVVILGMGTDGHTASLFPKAANLSEGLSLSSGRQCIAIEPLTAPHSRISMTLPRLLKSRQVIIHITGEEKKALLDRAATIENQSLLPISAVIQQQQTPVSLYYSP